MSFICGFSGNQEIDDLEDICILPSTPQRKTTRRRPSFGGRSNKDSKNPYANRGLDKFEALLADLDGKRQMIYTQKGSEDISLVRFTYSSSNDVKPIVVKVKDHRKQQDKLQHHHKIENIKTPVLSSSETLSHPAVEPGKSPVDCEKSVSFDQLRRKFGKWWRPSYGLPVFVMLILVFLTFFGRSFAIFCTSVGWYMLPTVNGVSEIAKRPKNARRKEYSRKMSEKIMVTSPRSVLNSGPVNTQPHRKSF